MRLRRGAGRGGAGAGLLCANWKMRKEARTPAGGGVRYRTLALRRHRAWRIYRTAADRCSHRARGLSPRTWCRHVTLADGHQTRLRSAMSALLCSTGGRLQPPATAPSTSVVGRREAHTLSNTAAPSDSVICAPSDVRGERRYTRGSLSYNRAAPCSPSRCFTPSSHELAAVFSGDTKISAATISFSVEYHPPAPYCTKHILSDSPISFSRPNGRSPTRSAWL